MAASVTATIKAAPARVAHVNLQKPVHGTVSGRGT